MSKRWKVRKRNAAKLEKSREVLTQFYDNVIAGLEDLRSRVCPVCGSIALKPTPTKEFCSACGDKP